MKKIFILASFMCLSIVAMGQSFELTGEFRYRPEFRNGYKQLPDSSTSPAAFVSQRNRIGMHYFNNGYEAQLTFQEGRIWGDQLLKSGKSTMGVLESWISMQLCDSARLKAGRQKIIVGNHRLFSDNNWSQTAQVHDAALFEWKSGNKKLMVAQAFNQKAENVFGTDYLNNAAEIKDNYKTLTIFRFEQKLGSFGLAVMGYADGFQDLNGEALYVRSTQGAEIKFSSGKWMLSGMAYYQTGHHITGAEVSAWFAAAEAGYKTEKMTVTAGAEMMSGNDIQSDSYEQFIPQYASNHTFAGYMDYFTNFATHTGGTGFTDLYLKGLYTHSKKHSFGLDYHYFATQQTTITGGASIDPFLAHEIDFTWKVAMTKELFFTLGYSLLSSGATLELIQAKTNPSIAHWAYICLEFKPLFFSVKK